MAYSRRTTETGTTFLPETDGTWTMMASPNGGNPDLIFIKTANTPSNHVELHIASGASNYETRVLETATTFVNENDGTWMMMASPNGGNPDLVYIKTANTPNNHVEVHIASGASNYQTRVLETATTFVNETDGVWTMAPSHDGGNPDLIYIKTANTHNNHVEVHIASGASNYQTRVLETTTTFVNETDGVWTMVPSHDGVNRDLVFIKTANTPNNHVEVHIASGASNYQTRILETATTFVNETDGTWMMVASPNGVKPDLIYIKTAHVETGSVEVHIASGN